jgi:hypothetical protein
LARIKKVKEVQISKEEDKPVNVTDKPRLHRPWQEDSPLWEKDDLVFEKECPNCKMINYSTEVYDRCKITGYIKFVCKNCGTEHKNPWYGTGPSYGNLPVWEELLRKPFSVFCVHTHKGVTTQKLYQAFDSLENNNVFIISKNDKGLENVEYLKEYFVINGKRR